MKKNNRKKNFGYLKAHVGHIIRCAEWNRGRAVRLEGFTPEGCMKVKDIISRETMVLPEEYLDKKWTFGR